MSNVLEIMMIKAAGERKLEKLGKINIPPPAASPALYSNPIYVG